MHIELTRTTGTKLKLNVLSIDVVESPQGGSLFSNSYPTSIKVGSSTYYVNDSYDEVSSKIDEVIAKLPTEVVINKYKNY